MVSGIRLEATTDGALKTFTNQLAALGEGAARQAMARAVNRAGRTVRGHVVKAVTKQTSAPKGLVAAVIKGRAAAHRGSGPVQFVIHATGSELTLRQFNPKQFSYGVRAKVWGKTRQFPSAFINAGYFGSGKPAHFGHVLVRTGGTNPKSGRDNAFEVMFGPSIPKEMVLAESKEVFLKSARVETEKRLRHEIGRLLPG